MDLFHHLGDWLGQAWALDELGLAHQLTGDYPAATACLAEAIELFRDLGDRHGLAKALNSLGELSLRTSAALEARSHHAEALAIARELGTPGEQARAALEGIGRSLLHRDPAEAAAYLRQALEIYQNIGAPGSCRTRSTPRASDKREARPWRILRSLRPPRGHAPTVILDKGDAASGSGRAVEQGLSVQQGPQPVPCPMATATAATRCRRQAIGRAYPGGSPDLGNSHRICPPVSSG